jgi:Domain of unknown function (DUF5642)
VRVFTACVAVALCGACSQADAPEPSNPTSSRAARVNLAHVDRVRGDLPAGYEVAGIGGRAAPVAFWGFGPEWVADPRQCGVLADPAGAATIRGWSASGPGGIVYVAASVALTGPDPALIGSCGTWTLSAGHTSGTVTVVDGPAIDDATTVGLQTDANTVVEGGTETHSHAATFTAYLDGYVAYATVVTETGSSGPALGADFAATLLVKTVSALRG